MQSTAPPGTSVFFTGVSAEVDEAHLRRHFESVGHVVSFRVHRQQPGKDFRSGVVEYMDDRSAQESISRLSGTSFGGRPMRVTAFSADKLSSRGGRGGAVGRGGRGVGRAGAMARGGFASARGGRGAAPTRGGRGFARGFSRGAGRGGESSRGFSSRGGGRGRATGTDLKRPREGDRPPFTDREGRELLQFPPTFFDPVLGRNDSIVLRSLQGMAAEEAYEAVEQLRVVALERKHDARLLLEENPALRSAVVMILQHAGRLRRGALPAEAFRADGEEELDTNNSNSGHNASHKEATGSSNVGSTAAAMAAAAAAAPSASSAPPAENEEGEDNAQDQVLEIISNMSEQDVDRILRLSDADLAQVADPAQRQQLEFLRHHLLEMAKAV